MAPNPSNEEWAIGEPKKFFISFKDQSGHDCAIHLYEFLKERNVDVFISDRDLQYDMTQGQWRKQIDRALMVARVFILIVTVTASTSVEIVRELEQVIERDDIEKFIFIDEQLWNDDNQTTIQLANGDQVNLKAFQAAKFENRFDLVRKVYSAVPIIAQIEFEEGSAGR